MPAPDARAFSVLAHQAVVDRSWDATIVPALRAPLPARGDDSSARTRFAYGGSHIADLGYFPLGEQALHRPPALRPLRRLRREPARAARDADEYAFALGALAHYVADTTGHPEATNRVVPEIYPELREEFGDERHLRRRPLRRTSRPSSASTSPDGAHARQAPDLFHHAIAVRGGEARCSTRRSARPTGSRLDDLFASTDVAITDLPLGVPRAHPRGDRHRLGALPGRHREARPDDDAGRLRVRPVARGLREGVRQGRTREPGYFAKFFAFVVEARARRRPAERRVVKPLPPGRAERFAPRSTTRSRATSSAVADVRREAPRRSRTEPRHRRARRAPAHVRAGRRGVRRRSPEARRERSGAAYRRSCAPTCSASTRRARGTRDDDDDRELDAALARLDSSR